MFIGVQLTYEAVMQPVQLKKNAKENSEGDFNGTFYEEETVDSKANLGKSPKKGGTFYGSKRHSRRSNSELIFGSDDAFVPCVVLMKKQNNNPYRPAMNIGTSARPPRTRRRASLGVIKENSGLEEAVKWSEIMGKRRTSLPVNLASSKKKAVMSSVLVDTATLVEVHSIVDELSTKPPNFFDYVKKLQGLLSPFKLDHVKPRQVVWLQKNEDGSDEEALCLSPSRPLSLKRIPHRRSDWQAGLFSTTTTATGLPKEEPGPVKPKRLPKISKDKTTPIGTPIDSRCSSPGLEGPAISYHLGRRRTYPNIPVSHSPKFSFPHSHSHHHNMVKKISQISSDYESDEPLSTLSVPIPGVIRSKSVIESNDPPSPPCHHCCPESHSSSNFSPAQEFFSLRTVGTPPSENDVILEEEDNRSGRHLTQCLCEQMDDGYTFFQNYQEKILESVYDWNFQIFELAENTDCGLSQMAFKLFQDTGLFETFKIPKKEFVCYMKALENGYREIPYHNRIHAADVLHGCWFLSTQEIPGFQDHSPLFSSDSSDSDSGASTTNTRQVNNIGHGSLAQAIPALELMSLYLAAAMHDYDHPGRTNAFLVETRHPLAILYNDRSVLENHHASASWKLLYSNKNFDFLRNLDTAEWKRLRFLIVEAILATDLKKHFEILSQFSAKSEQPLSRSTSTDDGDTDSPRKTGINWSADEDRLLVCKMVIKLADIGGPAKLKPLHVTWTKAICEEFFIQGDEERRLNVPVSPFMDREKPQVAELQRTFINNLIKPIVLSMHKTGILAGEIPEDHDLWEDKPQSSDENLLLAQLKSNLNFWKTKTPYTGHDEMREAFKHALPFRLGYNSSSENFKSHSMDLSSKGNSKAMENKFSYKSKINNEEPFENSEIVKDNKNGTSSKAKDLNTSSDTLSNSERRNSKLEPPKIIVG